jgi:hypothetical protein
LFENPGGRLEYIELFGKDIKEDEPVPKLV